MKKLRQVYCFLFVIYVNNEQIYKCSVFAVGVLFHILFLIIFFSYQNIYSYYYVYNVWLIQCIIEFNQFYP